MPTDGLGGPLEIVQLCAPAEVGGLERVVQGLCRGLAARGHDVTLVATVEDPAHAEALFEPLRSTTVQTMSYRFPGRAYLRELQTVRALLYELRPAVLHTHGYRSDLLHGGHARRAGIATVSTLHGSSRMGGLSRIFEWIQERALARFDGVVAVSPPLVDSLREKGVEPSRIHLVPNAWSPLEGRLSPEEARALLGVHGVPGPLVGWVGRLIPIKGADVFLNALSKLGRAEPWTACIVGDGPERATLEGLADELGIANRVRFLGSVPLAGRGFPAFDLFTLSSRSEGTPMVLLEAMSAGVPIVATAVGGVPDVLEAGTEAWLVPSESPTELAEALQAALADPPARAERAGKAAARLRRDFSEEAWINAHEDTYSSALRVRREG